MVKMIDQIKDKQNKNDIIALRIGLVIDAKSCIKMLFNAAEVVSTTKSKSTDVVSESRSRNRDLKRLCIRFASLMVRSMEMMSSKPSFDVIKRSVTEA